MVVPDLNYFKQKLETEKAELEKELSKIGRLDPRKKGDWELAPLPKIETDFRDEIADKLEEMDEREEIEITLEQRLRNVNRALEKIALAKYGVCEVGGEPIERERLEANPAARTCKAHLEEEGKRR